MAEGTSQLLGMHIHTCNRSMHTCSHACMRAPTQIKVKLGFDFKENTENCRGWGITPGLECLASRCKALGSWEGKQN